MKKNLIWFLMLLVPMAVVVAATNGPEVIKFEAKKGTVTFPHREHQNRIGADKCNTCHHTAKPDGSDAQKCTDCHTKQDVEKDGKVIPSLKNAKHKRCKGCHREQQKGPTKCDGCHAKKPAPAAAQ